MQYQTQKAPLEALELLGDFHPLVEQLGTVDGLVTLTGVSETLHLGRIDTLDALRIFLRDYHTRILCPIELPAIQTAWNHGSRSELRELVAFDQKLANEPILRNFAGASRRVGQGQLQKLRPLRDERIVQRYLAAVDVKQAHGWHTLVFGLTLAVYSLPLRQGLFGYAHQTTRGFIHAATRSLDFSPAEGRAVFDEICEPLPAAIEAMLASGIGH
ncbi:MAG TPA: urease accessory UreF family protein [Verrucomicrobiae bacterium]|nr:urease accessory UreF family protein [Verrucomicrobiae bacterium]